MWCTSYIFFFILCEEMCAAKHASTYPEVENFRKSHCVLCKDNLLWNESFCFLYPTKWCKIWTVCAQVWEQMLDTKQPIVHFYSNVYDTSTLSGYATKVGFYECTASTVLRHFIMNIMFSYVQCRHCRQHQLLWHSQSKYCSTFNHKLPI